MLNLHSKTATSKYDTDIIQIIEVKKNWNFKVKCNNCGKERYYNAGVYNKRTGKRLMIEEKYYPNTGMVPKQHKCIKGKFYTDGRDITESPEWIKPHWTYELEVTKTEHIMYKVLKTRNQILKYGDVDSVTYLQPIPKEWYSQSFTGGK